jgi:hypothetical protein
MTKKLTFLDTPEWASIVDNIKGIYTSDGTMSTLLDFERVLDEADIYAFKNWKFGELVDGPVVKRYSVTATFMWPAALMPDPRGAKRLIPLGCDVKFKKTKIKIPIEIKQPSDYKPGTHYPKMINREVWLVNIVIPKQLMTDIKEGSVEVASQTIDLEDLEKAYEQDYDTENLKDQEAPGGMPGGSMGGPPLPGLGGGPPLPGLGL